MFDIYYMPQPNTKRQPQVNNMLEPATAEGVYAFINKGSCHFILPLGSKLFLIITCSEKHGAPWTSSWTHTHTVIPERFGADKRTVCSLSPPLSHQAPCSADWQEASWQELTPKCQYSVTMVTLAHLGEGDSRVCWVGGCGCVTSWSHRSEQL